MFVGLNPSTANEIQNDPTVRRCINFAKSWGYGGMYMCNLFAYVSTDPDKLDTSGEDIGINNSWLYQIRLHSEIIIFAWGAFKQHERRMTEVIKMFPESYCLGITNSGYPKHPLYLKKDTKPIKFHSTLWL